MLTRASPSGDEMRVVYFDVSHLFGNHYQMFLEGYRSVQRAEGDDKLRGMLLAEREKTGGDQQMKESSRPKVLDILDRIEQELLGTPPVTDSQTGSCGLQCSHRATLPLTASSIFRIS